MSGHFTLTSAKEQSAEIPAPFNHWPLADGTVWLSFHRLEDGILLRFPGKVDFIAYLDDRATIGAPAPHTDRDLVEQLFWNQVRPLLLSSQGEFVFHAAAVTLPLDAIAFLGGPGAGKSTLAYALSTRADAQISTDEELRLSNGHQSAYIVSPGISNMRLRCDSMEHFSSLTDTNSSARPSLERADRGAPCPSPISCARRITA